MLKLEFETDGSPLSQDDMNAVLDDLAAVGHETDCADTCPRCGPLLRDARELLDLLEVRS